MRYNSLYRSPAMWSASGAYGFATPWVPRPQVDYGSPAHFQAPNPVERYLTLINASQRIPRPYYYVNRSLYSGYASPSTYFPAMIIAPSPVLAAYAVYASAFGFPWWHPYFRF